MRPSSSNSCHALGTELWLVVHTIRIQLGAEQRSIGGFGVGRGRTVAPLPPISYWRHGQLGGSSRTCPVQPGAWSPESPESPAQGGQGSEAAVALPGRRLR